MKGLHLNKRGVAELAHNFLNFLNKIDASPIQLENIVWPVVVIVMTTILKISLLIMILQVTPIG